MNNDKKQNTIHERQQREKEAILAQLRRLPVVQIALEKAEVGRTTYARWRAEDDEFRKAADDAMSEGDAVMNDMSEVQLFSLVKDKKHFGAIRYRLSRCHPKYADKLQLSGSISVKDEHLTPEQEEMVRVALRLVAHSQPENYDTDANT